jgi:hypothetical protein
LAGPAAIEGQGCRRPLGSSTGAWHLFLAFGLIAADNDRR